LDNIKRYIKETSPGQWSLAMFFIALLSGVVLMIPYDVNHPYRSVSQMLLANPYASWMRNIHYYSSQFFLVLLLLHLYEHFRKKQAVRLKQGIWLRLTPGLPVLFLVMFTGFLLRGDADTIQARHLAEQLTGEIPLVGNLLAFSIFGQQGSLQLIYINHAAVFSIISLIFIFEHSRKLWPELKTFVFAVIIVFAAGYYFSAPLHDNVHPVVKGPWYFLGLQNLLYRLSHPQWLLVIITGVLVLVYVAGLKTYRLYFSARKILLILMALYGLLTIDGLFFRGENWHSVYPWQKNYHYQVFGAYHFSKTDISSAKYAADILKTPPINGRQESCMVCHKKVKGFTASHNPETTGCFSCHGGNPFSTDKTSAHKNLILIPGNLSNAKRTCGTAGCHPEIVERTNKGLMATLSGMINVDRFVFNEQDTPDGMTTPAGLHHSPADEHLKNLCVRCHLGNEKHVTGAVTEESRGGGCVACHLNYDEQSLKAHAEYQQTGLLPDNEFHPSVNLKVTNDHCFGCHSRSGRISTNYEGWHETTLKPADVTGKKGFRLVEGTRVFRYVADDVHHAAGLECIDCHTSYELMGDGKHYQHQEDQQDVACTDCHTVTPDTINPLRLDGESAVIAGLRFGNITNRKFIRTKKHKTPLINTFVKNDSVFLIGKNSGKIHFAKPPATTCRRDNAHKAVSCSACHSGWAPTCIGCHNQYDPEEPGYNMLLNREQRGSWVEYTGEYNSLPPTLGVRTAGNEREIIPVIPGMVLTIDLHSYDKHLPDSLVFHRLFAPAAPHTTVTRGRSCKSCHNNPLALGYGKGTLTYKVTGNKGKWHFEPFYTSNENDGLPEDAWIPFLGSRTGKVSTRTNVVPLTVSRQKKMLTVGACLTCHDEKSEVIEQTLTDFSAVIKRKKAACVLPF